MRDGKVKKILIITAAFIIVMLCFKEYIDMKNYYIYEKVITDFISGTSNEKIKAKKIIIKNILTHWDYSANNVASMFNSELDYYEAMNLAAFKVNIRSKNDILFALQINERLSVIGVYEKVGSKYAFLAKLDSFVDLKDVQPIKLEEEGYDLIAVREQIPCTQESKEESTYIRIYYYDKKQFNIVMNVLEKYNWYHNEAWDYPKLSEANWLSVTQKADVLWENEYYPKITLKLWQTYGVSDEINTTFIPKDYSIISRRDFTNMYNWSKKYSHFILYEGVNTKNGKKAAVIEDLGQSPHSLVSELVNENNYYRVKYENGSIEKIDKKWFIIKN